MPFRHGGRSSGLECRACGFRMSGSLQSLFALDGSRETWGSAEFCSECVFPPSLTGSALETLRPREGSAAQARHSPKPHAQITLSPEAGTLGFESCLCHWFICFSCFSLLYFLHCMRDITVLTRFSRELYGGLPKPGALPFKCDITKPRVHSALCVVLEVNPGPCMLSTLYH